MEPNTHTVVSLMRQRAETDHDRPVYTLLAQGKVVDQLSFATLHARATAVAAQLAGCSAPGDRVLVLCPPGLDYIAAFFGCLLAGRIAVPAYPPRSPRHMQRLHAIFDDSQARGILTTRALGEPIRAALDPGTLARTTIVAVDDAPAAGAWDGPTPRATDVAFLQYTSGSTGAPKGVIVTHRNLMANSAMMQDAFQLDAGQVYVSWLPLFHDMGLMGMVQGVYAGAHEVILSPLEFIARPFRWLEAIATYRASVSGGPNFAYELCAARIADGDLRALDLSSWRRAFNGSEPVQAETLERFTRRFEACGFRHQAHYPCYGLAEATLFVSGAARPRDPVMRTLSKAAIAEGALRDATDAADAKRLVGCGQAFGDEVIAIVHPEQRTRLPDGQLGEIWVSSEAVAAGYWRNAPATVETFEAVLADEPDGRCYLRTGDLGLIEAGELYVAGRIKDLIIVRGQNYYPQDIEVVAQQSHPALVAGAGAAFEAGDGVVLVQELRRTSSGPSVAEVTAAIKQAVVEALGLELSQVVLVPTRGVPRTSSGKIQRRRTRQLYLDRTLEPIPGEPIPGAASAAAHAPVTAVDRTALEGALRSIVAGVLKRPFILVDLEAPLGLDDRAASLLGERIRAELGMSLPVPIVASATVSALVDQLLPAASPASPASGT
ncbi:MAG TPA: fatty acyl-AMP ligase [Kofleriaceae bacterium]|nr:fatty acyl-AMP ligase [Kofleriaceae bacterium]